MTEAAAKVRRSSCLYPLVAFHLATHTVCHEQQQAEAEQLRAEVLHLRASSRSFMKQLRAAGAAEDATMRECLVGLLGPSLLLLHTT